MTSDAGWYESNGQFDRGLPATWSPQQRVNYLTNAGFNWKSGNAGDALWAAPNGEAMSEIAAFHAIANGTVPVASKTNTASPAGDKSAQVDGAGHPYVINNNGQAVDLTTGQVFQPAPLPVNPHPGQSFSINQSVADPAAMANAKDIATIQETGANQRNAATIGANVQTADADRIAKAQQAQAALQETIRSNVAQESADKIRVAVLQRQADIQEQAGNRQDAQATRALAEQVATRIQNTVQQRSTLLQQAAIANQQADAEAARINEQSKKDNLDATRAVATDIGNFTSKPGDIGKAAGYLASYGADSESPISTAIRSGANAVTPDRMAILDTLSDQHNTLAKGPSVFNPSHINPDVSLYDQQIDNYKNGATGFGGLNTTPGGGSAGSTVTSSLHAGDNAPDPDFPEYTVAQTSEFQRQNPGWRSQMSTAKGMASAKPPAAPPAQTGATIPANTSGTQQWQPTKGYDAAGNRYALGTDVGHTPPMETVIAGDSTAADPAAGGAHPEAITPVDPPGPNNASVEIDPMTQPGVGDTSGGVGEVERVASFFDSIALFLRGGDSGAEPIAGGRFALGTNATDSTNPLFAGDTTGAGIMAQSIEIAKRFGGFGDETPTPVSVATPGYSPFRQQIAGSVASTATGIDPALFDEEVQKATPVGRSAASSVVKRTA